MNDARYIARDREKGLFDPAYQLIIRAEWCRGERQRLALQHLRMRGLWLSTAQKQQATHGVTDTEILRLIGE